MVREFAIRSADLPVKELLTPPNGGGPSLPVYPLGRDYPEFEDSFLVAITEQRSPDDIEWLATRLEEAAE